MSGTKTTQSAKTPVLRLDFGPVTGLKAFAKTRKVTAYQVTNAADFIAPHAGTAALSLSIVGQRPMLALQPVVSKEGAKGGAKEALFATAHRLDAVLRRAGGLSDAPGDLVIAAPELSAGILALMGALPAPAAGRLGIETQAADPKAAAATLTAALPRWQLDTTETAEKKGDTACRIWLVPAPAGTVTAAPVAMPTTQPVADPVALLPQPRSALSQVAVAEVPDLLKGLEIDSADFFETEITGTIGGPNAASAAALPSVLAFSKDEIVAMAPVRREGGKLTFQLDLPRAFLFDGAEEAIELRLGVPSVSSASTSVALPKRRLLSAERLLAFDQPDLGGQPSGRKPFGIVLYSFTRTEAAMLVLESLKKQNALQYVEIWMDGDQGKPGVKKQLEDAEAEFRAFGVQKVTRHRGNLGFRKLILQSLMYMTETYDRFIVLEDDCFPNRDAVSEFIKGLDTHADDPQVLTTYGHHFLVPAEQPLCPRFQGWGWATWSDKIKPVLAELAYLYSLREEAFTDWAKEMLTPEIMARLDCTAPRGASITVQRFFAWDETLALVSALADMKHAPTEKRCIYNFGVGEDSTHFTNIDWYRKPPFNMILKSEVWDHF